MKYAIAICVLCILAMLLAMFGCAETHRPGTAAVGDALSAVYVVDAKTGDCVRVWWNGSIRPVVSIRRVTPQECVR